MLVNTKKSYFFKDIHMFFPYLSIFEENTPHVFPSLSVRFRQGFVSAPCPQHRTSSNISSPHRTVEIQPFNGKRCHYDDQHKWTEHRRLVRCLCQSETAGPMYLFIKLELLKVGKCYMNGAMTSIYRGIATCFCVSIWITSFLFLHPWAKLYCKWKRGAKSTTNDSLSVHLR